MTLRVLLAESGTEDTLYLRDVLTDLDGARCWGDWVRLQVSHTATWAETEALLAAEPVDILLLDPDFEDSQGADTFRRVQAAAPDVPVILLVEPYAVSLGERMVRAGAQDFLVKKEVDCAPLARVIRNALERHRLLAATRAASMTDPLTGVLTAPAFLSLAQRDCLLAERLGRRLLVLLAEPVALSGFRSGGVHRLQHLDLALVEAADRLRALAGPAALVARLEYSRFGLSVFDTEADPAEELRTRLAAKTADFEIAFGAAVLDPHHPVSLDTLLDQAERSLRGTALFPANAR